MSAADKVLALALKLPVEERRFIARALAASLDGAPLVAAPDEPAAAAWVEDFERKVEQVLEGQAALDPIDDPDAIE